MIQEHKYYVDEIMVAWRMPSDESLVVYQFPFVDWLNAPNHEYSILQAEEENKWTEQFRTKMFVQGWWWACQLPYTAHVDGGIVVTKYLALSPEITFASPWEFPINGYNQAPWCEGVLLPSCLLVISSLVFS